MVVPNARGALLELLRLGFTLCRSIQLGQVGEDGGDIRVVEAEALFHDRQRALEARLGLRIETLIMVEQSQVVQDRPHLEIVGSEELLSDRQRPRSALEIRSSLRKPGANTHVDHEPLCCRASRVVGLQVSMHPP